MENSRHFKEQMKAEILKSMEEVEPVTGLGADSYVGQCVMRERVIKRINKFEIL